MRRNFRPLLENLEPRIDLACIHTFVVTNPFALQGRGSLAFAADKAHRGDRIVFAKGIEVAAQLKPITFHPGVTLSGGHHGVLLLTAASIDFTDVRVRHIQVDPLPGGRAVLD